MALIDDVQKELTRNAEGRFNEADVMAFCDKRARTLVDVETLYKAKANTMFKSLFRENELIQPATEQLCFGDFEPVDYHGMRLVSDGKGSCVELDNASVEFRQAALDRAKINLDRVKTKYKRERAEVAHFRNWSTEQGNAGRPTLELTWGNCARETGLLRPISKTETNAA